MYINIYIDNDILGVYIQPYYTGCLATLAFAPKTTVTAFCTHFMATLKKVAGISKHTKVRELLIALNKIHSRQDPECLQINLQITGGMESDQRTTDI